MTHAFPTRRPSDLLYRPLTDAAARATIRAAWDAGIRYFDTAPHYGFGLSEKRLGAALAEIDPDAHAIVSTKVGRRLDPVPDADLTRPRQGFVSPRSEEHTSELQSLMRISYAVFCLKK